MGHTGNYFDWFISSLIQVLYLSTDSLPNCWERSPSRKYLAAVIITRVLFVIRKGQVAIIITITPRVLCAPWLKGCHRIFPTYCTRNWLFGHFCRVHVIRIQSQNPSPPRLVCFTVMLLYGKAAGNLFSTIESL